MRPQLALRMCGTAARDIRKAPLALTPIVRSQAATGTFSISLRSAPCGAPALLTRMSSRPYRASTSSTMRLASSSRLTSPKVAEAVPPACADLLDQRIDAAPIGVDVLRRVEFVGDAGRAQIGDDDRDPLGGERARGRIADADRLAAAGDQRDAGGVGHVGSPFAVLPLSRIAGEGGRGLSPLAGEGSRSEALTLPALARWASLSRNAGEGLLRESQTGLVPLSWVRCIRRRAAGSKASRRCIAQRLSHHTRSPTRHSWRPGEAVLLRVLPQEVEQRLAFRDRQADDIGVDAAAEEQALFAGLGVGAHQRLARAGHFRDVLDRLEALMRLAAADVRRGVDHRHPVDPLS